MKRQPTKKNTGLRCSGGLLCIKTDLWYTCMNSVSEWKSHRPIKHVVPSPSSDAGRVCPLRWISKGTFTFRPSTDPASVSGTCKLSANSSIESWSPHPFYSFWSKWLDHLFFPYRFSIIKSFWNLKPYIFSPYSKSRSTLHYSITCSLFWHFHLKLRVCLHFPSPSLLCCFFSAPLPARKSLMM